MYLTSSNVFEGELVQFNGESYGNGEAYLRNMFTGIGIGDANEDGVLDVRDLIRMKKYATGIITEISNYADIDFDGFVSATDLTEIRKILLTK